MALIPRWPCSQLCLIAILPIFPTESAPPQTAPTLTKLVRNENGTLDVTPKYFLLNDNLKQKIDVVFRGKNGVETEIDWQAMEEKELKDAQVMWEKLRAANPELFNVRKDKGK